MPTQYDLTNAQKAEVLISHLKTLSTAKYNAEISLLEENSTDEPSQEFINGLNSQISAISAKIAVLEAKLLEVSGQ
jgi:hypothetical protein